MAMFLSQYARALSVSGASGTRVALTIVDSAGPSGNTWNAVTWSGWTRSSVLGNR